MDKIFRSPLYNPNFKEPSITFYEHILGPIKRKTEENPEFPCVSDGATGETILVKDVIPGTRKVISGLNKLGFKKRDVLCIITENRCDVIYAMLAALGSGGILATLVPYLPKDDLQKLLLPMNPSVIVCCDSSEKTVRDIEKEGLLEGTLIYSFDDSQLYTRFRSLLSDDERDFIEDFSIDYKKDPILYLPSSGTTGTPKIIQHTNYTVMVALVNSDRTITAANVSSFLSLNCFYHISGVLVNLLLLGVVKIVLLSNAPYTEDKILKCIQDYKIMGLFMFPFQVAMLSNFEDVSLYDTSTLRLVYAGGSKLYKKDVERFRKRFPFTFIVEGYASTEVLQIVRSDPPYNGKWEQGSVGILGNLVEAKVIDSETGELLGPNQKGELCIRCPAVTIGYKDYEQANIDAFDEDGFFRLGDLGYIDEDCYLFIEDRIKNIIKFQTKETSIVTIYCHDIESILLNHPDVLDAAVCSARDPIYQEVPKAFVQVSKVSKITEKELLDYANEKLDDIRQIRGGLVILDALPRNSNGKLLRSKLNVLI